MPTYKEYDDWLIKFIIKHAPIDSEDVNKLIQMTACTKFFESHNSDSSKNVHLIDEYQQEIFKKIKPFIIVTGRN